MYSSPVNAMHVVEVHGVRRCRQLLLGTRFFFFSNQRTIASYACCPMRVTVAFAWSWNCAFVGIGGMAQPMQPSVRFTLFCVPSM